MASEFKATGFIGVASTLTVPSVVMGALEAAAATLEAGVVLAAPLATSETKRKHRHQRHLRRLQKKEPGCHDTIKEEVYPSHKAKGECHRCLTCPCGGPTLELEEEGSEFRDDNYNPLSAGKPRTEQLEEEELA